MKKSDLKKIHALKRTFYSNLLTSFKRALRIIGNESKSTSDLQISRKGLSDTFLTYDRLEEIDAQLLKMERRKAEAIQLIRKHNRCV